MENSDCIVIQGSNMAECHPVAFRWASKAKINGAKILHIDPRFTRTSAMADLYAPIRAGSDIVLLGGLINYVMNDERWNSDPFFQEYLVHYTNAATIIDERFQDSEDLNGVFSGLMQVSGGDQEWHTMVCHSGMTTRPGNMRGVAMPACSIRGRSSKS
jgi:formate dehydrogenase major subunit